MQPFSFLDSQDLLIAFFKEACCSLLETCLGSRPFLQFLFAFQALVADVWHANRPRQNCGRCQPASFSTSLRTAVSWARFAMWVIFSSEAISLTSAAAVACVSVKI